MRNIERSASVEAVIEALDKTANKRTLVLLCDILAEMKSNSSLPALIRLLQDQDRGVRAAATDAIGKVVGYKDDPPDSKIRGVVLKAILDLWHVERSKEVRSTIIQTLALINDPSVEPILLAALHDAEPLVRGQAVWGLEFMARSNP